MLIVCIRHIIRPATMYLNSTKSILSQEINGSLPRIGERQGFGKHEKYVWIVDAKAKELGVSLTDQERKTIDTNMDQAWNSSKEQLSKYGITKEGAQQFFYDFNAKFAKIFQTLYGEGGEKAIPAEDKKNYFIENYTDFAYFTKSISGLSDEDKAAAKANLDGYAAAINDGSRTMEQVAEEYKTAENLSTNHYKVSNKLIYQQKICSIIFRNGSCIKRDANG